MRSHLLLGVLFFVAGCATDPDLDSASGALHWDDADTLEITSETLGVARPTPGGPDCSRGATRYDFADARLVVVSCGVEHVHVGTAQDTADLRAALRGLRVVQLACDGYDGTNVSAGVHRGVGGAGVAYPVGATSCTNGGDPARPIPVISLASWEPVQRVIQRITLR